MVEGEPPAVGNVLPATMMALGLNRRFFDTTRGRIVRLLRRAQRTVDELAQELGLTDNAVRAHLASLERDGMVRIDGVRRQPGAGKPATVYEIHPDAETLLSRGYVPLLTSLLAELGSRLSPTELENVMRDVGRRLAAGRPVTAPATFDQRIDAAAALMADLGGEVTIERTEDTIVIRGCACPLAAAVNERPEVCRALETLLAELTGGEVHERCDRSGTPRCRFELHAR